MINIGYIDLVRLDLFIVFFHLTWSFPLQVIVIVILLLHVIGISTLAGVCILIAMIPIQIYIVKLLVSLRKSNANKTDQRVSFTSEILSAIRVIKFFAWEESFLSRIFEIREKELKVSV